MTASNKFLRLVPGTLLGLLLLIGCSARLQQASLGPKDVCLRLSSMDEKSDRLRCGYYAVKQVSQYYHPEITDDTFKTDSLIFENANDTVSVLHCLNDNVEIPLEMKNGELQGLLKSIATGDPIVVFVPGDAFAIRGLNLIGPSLLHCIVIAGHNADETEFFFYSDGKGPFVIDRVFFARQWKRVDNLCIMRNR